MALDDVPRDSLDPTTLDSLMKDLDKLQMLAAKALKEAQQVQTISEEATKSYKTLNDHMDKTDKDKNSAVQQIQGLPMSIIHPLLMNIASKACPIALPFSVCFLLILSSFQALSQTLTDRDSKYAK